MKLKKCKVKPSKVTTYYVGLMDHKSEIIFYIFKSYDLLEIKDFVESNNVECFQLIKIGPVKNFK